MASNNKTPECPISLHPLGETAFSLKCGHIICTTCTNTLTAKTASPSMSCPLCRKIVKKKYNRKVYIPYGPSNDGAGRAPLAPATSIENLLNDTVKEASEQLEHLGAENTRLETELKGAGERIAGLLDAVRIADSKVRDGAWHLDAEIRASHEARREGREAREEAWGLRLWVHRLAIVLLVLVVLLFVFGTVMTRFAKVASKVTGETVWQCYMRAVCETLRSLFQL